MLKLVKNNIFTIILLVLSILLAFIPFFIVPVCATMHNGMYMSCYHSGILVRNIAISLFLINLISFFVKNKLKILLNTAVIILCSLVHLIPHRILKVQFGYNAMKNTPRFYGFCSMDSMHCVHNKTFIWTSIIVGIMIVFAIFSIIFIVLKKEEINE